MSATINNSLQNPGISRKERGRPGLPNQPTRADKSQVDSYGMTDGSKDTVEIKNSLRYSIESNRASSETTVKDLDEAQELVKEVIGLVHSDDRESHPEQVYNFNQENLARLLCRF